MLTDFNVLSAVAFHHAGLELDDRRVVESSFLAGKISILCATSTLAVSFHPMQKATIFQFLIRCIVTIDGCQLAGRACRDKGNKGMARQERVSRS